MVERWHVLLIHVLERRLKIAHGLPACAEWRGRWIRADCAGNAGVWISALQEDFIRELEWIPFVLCAWKPYHKTRAALPRRRYGACWVVSSALTLLDLDNDGCYISIMFTKCQGAGQSPSDCVGTGWQKWLSICSQAEPRGVIPQWMGFQKSEYHVVQPTLQLWRALAQGPSHVCLRQGDEPQTGVSQADTCSALRHL